MDVILQEETARLVSAAITLMDLGAVDYQLLQYDTIVFGQENYGDYTGTDRTADQEAGRVRFGQPIDTAFEAAVSRYQEGTGAEDAGSVRGSVQQTAAVAAAEGTIGAASTRQPEATVQRDGGINSPPVREDGRVELKHWSRKENLEELDPAFHGTGIALPALI